MPSRTAPLAKGDAGEKSPGDFDQASATVGAVNALTKSLSIRQELGKGKSAQGIFCANLGHLRATRATRHVSVEKERAAAELRAFPNSPFSEGRRRRKIPSGGMKVPTETQWRKNPRTPLES